MIHAGVLKKFGLYGLIRIALPLLPNALHASVLSPSLFTHAPFSWLHHSVQNWLLSIGWMNFLAWLCLGNILYVGWVAMRQRDLNLLIGNSSVAHMGFIFLGIASLNLIGITGAVFVMIAHGFLAALTFGLSGYIYQKTGTLEMSELGGLCRKLRFIGTALLMAAMAGCGLPGFANFVGEVSVFFASWTVFPLVTVLAVWGALVIGGIYMTRAVRKILHGPLPEKYTNVADATNIWRKLPYALLLASLFVFGCFPKLLTNQITPDADKIVSMAILITAKPNVVAVSEIQNPKSENRN
jgi:NADH-quinone oxidoreductase subunit M